jgi:phage portal protein BeeE
MGWGSFDFKNLMTSWTLTWGDAFAEIIRDQAGRTIALWPLHPAAMLVDRDDRAVAVELGSRDRARLPRPARARQLRGTVHARVVRPRRPQDP